MATKHKYHVESFKGMAVRGWHCVCNQHGINVLSWSHYPGAKFTDQEFANEICHLLNRGNIMRTRLSISDQETNFAQSLGAQYDKEKHEWFVENQEDLLPFLRWMDKRLLRPCKPVVCRE